MMTSIIGWESTFTSCYKLQTKLYVSFYLGVKSFYQPSIMVPTRIISCVMKHHLGWSSRAEWQFRQNLFPRPRWFESCSGEQVVCEPRYGLNLFAELTPNFKLASESSKCHSDFCGFGKFQIFYEMIHATVLDLEGFACTILVLLSSRPLITRKSI